MMEMRQILEPEGGECPYCHGGCPQAVRWEHYSEICDDMAEAAKIAPEDRGDFDLGYDLPVHGPAL